MRPCGPTAARRRSRRALAVAVMRVSWRAPVQCTRRGAVVSATGALWGRVEALRQRAALCPPTPPPYNNRVGRKERAMRGKLNTLLARLLIGWAIPLVLFALVGVVS